MTYHYTPKWVEETIESMDNGQWAQAMDQIMAGVRRKPGEAIARGIHLAGLLHERRGEAGLEQASRLLKTLRLTQV